MRPLATRSWRWTRPDAGTGCEPPSLAQQSCPNRDKADALLLWCAQSAQVLGRGACKTVYRGFDEEDAREVAWNRVHEFVTSKDERERLMAEVWSQLAGRQAWRLGGG